MVGDFNRSNLNLKSATVRGLKSIQTVESRSEITNRTESEFNLRRLNPDLKSPTAQGSQTNSKILNRDQKSATVRGLTFISKV